MVLRDVVSCELPGKLSSCVSLLSSDEKPKFYISCLDLLRQFVIECEHGLDVRNKIHLAMCALCPTLVEVADLTLLCGFVDDLAGFFRDRGYLWTIEQ